MMEFEVLHVTWDPDERIDELMTICQDCNTENLEKKFTEYVVQNIEPIGWSAVWRSLGTNSDLPKELQLPYDWVAEVKDVSHNFLEAKIKILGLAQESPQIASVNDVIGREVLVPLIELYPLSKQDNDAIHMEVTAEVIEQIRFFYHNIWLPWDASEEECFYTKSVVEERMKIYHEMESGAIPSGVAKQMRSTVLSAAELRRRVEQLESHSGIAFEEEVDETVVVELLALNKDIERFQCDYDTLKDPTLRQLSSHQRQLERRTLLHSVPHEATIFVVCGNVALGVFVSAMEKLTCFVQTLPKVPSISASVQTMPSLQLAADVAKVGDLVVLLPPCSAPYTLDNLGLLAKGGTICCIDGTATIIDGDPLTGDVFMDLDFEDEEQQFTLASITLEAAEKEIAILCHRGALNIRNCCIKGADVGVSLLGGSKCRITESSIEGGVGGSAHGEAFNLQPNAQVTIGDEVMIKNYHIGISDPQG